MRGPRTAAALGLIAFVLPAAASSSFASVSGRSSARDLAAPTGLKGFALNYDEALKLCTEEAAKLLVDEWEFSVEDAFIFLSVACDAGVAQACKPAPGGFGTIARFSIPKLDATPRPFS